MKEIKSNEDAIIMLAVAQTALETYSNQIQDKAFNKIIDAIDQCVNYLATETKFIEPEMFFDECMEIESIIEVLSVIQDMDHKIINGYALDKLLLMPIDKLICIKQTLNSYN